MINSGLQDRMRRIEIAARKMITHPRDLRPRYRRLGRKQLDVAARALCTPRDTAEDWIGRSVPTPLIKEVPVGARIRVYSTLVIKDVPSRA